MPLDPTNEVVDDPAFRIVFVFHNDLELFSETAPRCLDALTSPTREQHEIVVYCDGTSPGTLRQLFDVTAGWGVDEVVVRHRGRYLASGAPGNNSHRRLFPTRSTYLCVIEDDVVIYKTDVSFDALGAIRETFVREPESVALFRVDDHENWAWPLADVAPPTAAGDRVVNRVATHFICYDTRRFTPVADALGAFRLDTFVDRDDWSYNWEDLVSHVGTTGGRKILFTETWPLQVFHCDEKVAPGSMYHTQDPAVKLAVFRHVDSRYGATGANAR